MDNQQYMVEKNEMTKNSNVILYGKNSVDVVKPEQLWSLLNCLTVSIYTGFVYVW